ncbi:MAG: O-antigen ligase family protein, partial [Solirubrobacterales bacterium]|nr:O-antigen ligase family protein [Solirubrobacterales bacterium]
TDDTLQARTYIWGQAARAFLQEPIIGHGYKYSEKGNFVEAAGSGSVSHHQSTHNDILSHLVDGGVIGGALFLFVLGLMFALARRSVGNPALRPLGIGYSCMLIAMIVSGIDNTLSESAAVITFQWLAFGVMGGLVAVPGNPGRAGGQARWLGGGGLRGPQTRTASHHALHRAP